MEDIISMLQKMIDEKNNKTDSPKPEEITESKSDNDNEELKKLREENKRIKKDLEDTKKRIPIIVENEEKIEDMKINILANWYKYFNGEVDYFLTLGCTYTKLTLPHPETKQLYSFMGPYFYIKNDESIWVDENTFIPINEESKRNLQKSFDNNQKAYSVDIFKRLKELFQKESNGRKDNSESEGINQ